MKRVFVLVRFVWTFVGIFTAVFAVVALSIFNTYTSYALQSENSAWFEDENLDGNEEDNNAEFSSSKIFIETEDLDHDILKVSIKCEGLETPVLGIAFHLFYDKNLIGFLRYDPGDFLEKGGDPFYIVSVEKDLNKIESGELIFGETLRRNDNFPIGDGVISDFYFQKIGEFYGKKLSEFSGSDSEVNSSDSKINSRFSVFELNFKNGVVSTMNTTRQDLDTIDFVDFKYREEPKAQEGEGLVENPVENEDNFQANVVESFNDFSVVFVIIAGVFFGTAGIFFFKYKKIKAKI